MMLRDVLGTPVRELRALATRPVKVAVLDSGIDSRHPDLAGFVDAAHAGVVEDGVVRVVARTVPANNDEFGHGTAVAGVLCSVAPNARITDYRIIGKGTQQGNGNVLLAALEHAIAADHRVINLSLAAKAEYADRLSKLCDLAYRKGVMIIAAKRNMPLTDLGFPAVLTSVISVDKSCRDDPLHLTYQLDSIIEFVSHGEDVRVAAPDASYTTKSGTSFATPVVSAVAALLLGTAPQLRPFELKSYLRSISR